VVHFDPLVKEQLGSTCTKDAALDVLAY